MHKLALIITLLFCTNASANTNSDNFGYKQCNHHKFTFLFLKAYDVYLCANETKYLKPDKIYQTDFSLIINYNMNFAKAELAKSSIEEMNRYYEISKKDQSEYYQELFAIFPNVKKHDIIEAKYNKNGKTSFFHNKSQTGKINKPDFSRKFLDIWLYQNNKYPNMTKDLFQ